MMKNPKKEPIPKGANDEYLPAYFRRHPKLRKIYEVLLCWREISKVGRAIIFILAGIVIVGFIVVSRFIT
jgi:hypothetical protein